VFGWFELADRFEQAAARLGETQQFDDGLVRPLLLRMKGEAEERLSAAAQPAKRPKKKHGERGGRTRDLIVAALSKHHQYADGGCLNLEPIGGNKLASLASVSKSAVSKFFAKEFGGHAAYRRLCQDSLRLAAALRLLNGEITPRILSGGSLIERVADKRDEQDE